MTYVIVGIVTIAICIGAFVIGLREGRIQGEGCATIVIIFKLKDVFNRVLMLVPAEKHEELSTIIKDFYDDIQVTVDVDD